MNGLSKNLPTPLLFGLLLSNFPLSRRLWLSIPNFAFLWTLETFSKCFLFLLRRAIASRRNCEDLGKEGLEVRLICNNKKIKKKLKTCCSATYLPCVLHWIRSPPSARELPVFSPLELAVLGPAWRGPPTQNLE